MFSRYAAWFKELLFPVSCLTCGEDGTWCCKRCLAVVRPLEHQACPLCHHPTSYGQTCSQCIVSSHLDGIFSFFPYRDNATLESFIKNLKYQYARDMMVVLPDMVREAARPFTVVLERSKGVKVCLPIPLHDRRERERGFNQSALIAESLVAVWRQHGASSVELAPLPLERIRATKPQATLPSDERAANIQGAFSWNSTDKPPQEVILVDDVYTTGATMQECAHVLKRHGARWVWGVTLARG